MKDFKKLNIQEAAKSVRKPSYEAILKKFNSIIADLIYK